MTESTWVTGKDGKRYLPEDSFQSIKKVFDSLLSTRSTMDLDGKSPLQNMRFPVGSDNGVSIIFDRTPTQDEIDRAAAHLMFYKEMADHDRPDLMPFDHILSVLTANTEEAVLAAKDIDILKAELADN